MALVTCGGADVLRARLHLPQRGPWFADLTLDTATAPSGRVTIAASGGLSLKGTVTRAGVQLDAAHVRVVGGAGGLGVVIPAGAWSNAQLRDPLKAALDAGGETASTTISSAISGAVLSTWTHAAQVAAVALDRLAYAAGKATGSSVLWRVLSDGTVWLGAEVWTSATLPAGADVLDRFPSENRVEIGAETPALLPGVNLDQVGKVAAVDHWITSHGVRTDAWLA